MSLKRKILLSAVLCLCPYGVFAQTDTAENVTPVSVRAKGQRAQAFQEMIERYFRVDDRLLMPLGFLAVTNHIRKTDEMKRLVKNGITFIHRYDSLQPTWRVLEDIDNCMKAGVPLAVNLPRKHLHKDNRWWSNYLKDFIGSGQIIIWYLPEEPEAKDLAKLRELTELLHELDKLGRPVMTYLKGQDSDILTEASMFMDCVVYGAYPGHGWGGGARLRIARRMLRAYSCGAPAVMSAQEAFKTSSGWTKPEHVIFDTYIALIYGAKGIWWYGYHYARDNDELLEAVLRQAATLNGPEHLGEVFLRGSDNNKIRARVLGGPTTFPKNTLESKKMYLGGKVYPSVNWRAYNHRGSTYLVMANGCEMIKESNPKACEEDLTVEIQFWGFNPKSKITLLDGTVESENKSGKLTVILEPLEVGVFKIAELSTP